MCPLDARTCTRVSGDGRNFIPPEDPQARREEGSYYREPKAVNEYLNRLEALYRRATPLPLPLVVLVLVWSRSDATAMDVQGPSERTERTPPPFKRQ